MSGLAIAALVLACVWLGILTLVVVVLVRQIGLLTVRLSNVSQPLSSEDDGPEIGSSVPEEVAAQLPELEGERAYLLLVAATCTPCRELIADIGEHYFEQTVTALVPGRVEAAEEFARFLPSCGIRPVVDPQATTLAQALKIQSTPSVLEVERGTITRKAYLYDGGSDLIRFLEDGAPSARSSGLAATGEGEVGAKKRVEITANPRRSR
jgi:hypothetical protein